MLNSLNQEVQIVETELPKSLKGLYLDGIICLSNKLKTKAEKESILAEELGHHYTTEGNILDQSNLNNAKQEESAFRSSLSLYRL